MLGTSIYQKLLGADFERLGPILQHVHGSARQVHAQGRITVTHGKGMAVRWTNRLMGVPAAGELVDLRLEILRVAEQETWIRKFEGKPLVTRQWAENGLFIEAIGPTKMAMRLRVASGTLHFDPVYSKFLGIKIPNALSVSVLASAQETESGWSIMVETRSTLLGLLFRYDGKIALTP